MKNKEKLRPKLYSFFITSNIIIYSFFIALFLKGGPSYAENLPLLKFGKDGYPIKIASSQISKTKPIKEDSKIIDPPKINIFPWGQCTWYVATKRNITWNGNARDWYRNAIKVGRKVGTEPRVGSIVVLDRGYYGHVGYVEMVNKDNFTFSESNNPIPGKITIMTLNRLERTIIGFIY